MKADFTRSTFDPRKHFHGVRQQQGRVQLDSDWNEQVDLANYRIEVGTLDLLGGCGGLIGSAGFSLGGGTVPTLGAGRFYVDGILVQNDQDALRLDKQPDLPGYTLPSSDGYFLAYLDVWLRGITALEDSSIREVALGGPDTAMRERTTWQVRLLSMPGPGTCADDLPFENLLTPIPAPGKLAADAPEGAAPADLCDVPAVGGYRRLENQLYRVEIHKSGVGSAATFKWSRDNGSVVTSWNDQQGTDLVVGSIGRDRVLGFAPGQTVELIDDARELNGQPGTLVHISNAEGGADGSVLTLDPSDPNTAGVNKTAQFPDTNGLGLPNHPRVRRWDSDGEQQVKVGTWILLEDGVMIKFDSGTYRTGDYWLIPARSAVGDILWPRDSSTPSQPIALEAEGIRHHFCKLGILQRVSGTYTLVEDCRPLYPALPDLINFQYLGGDGQETMPGDVLPQLLQVGVTMGKWPLGKGPLVGKKFKVRFEVVNNDGVIGINQLAAASSSSTFLWADVIDGVAACAWKPANDTSRPSQQLTATLYLSDEATQTGHPPITFTANLSLASQVAYIPDGKCTALASATNVQDALDILCEVREGKGCCYTVGDGGDFPNIDQALKELVEKGERQICLCLLAGTQTSAGVTITVEKETHLRIHGGAGSLLTLQDAWELEGFTSVALEDLSLRIPPGMNQKTAVVSVLKAGEVTLRNLQVEGNVDRGFFFFLAAESATLENNNIRIFTTDKALAGLLEKTPMAALLHTTDSVQLQAKIQELAAGELSKATSRRLLSKNFLNMTRGTGANLTADQTAAVADFSNAIKVNSLETSVLEAAMTALIQTVLIPARAVCFDPLLSRGYLRDNTIFGLISFYGPPAAAMPTAQNLLVAFQDNKNMEMGGVSFTAARHSLVLCDNVLTSLTVGNAVFKMILDALKGKTTNAPHLFADAMLQGNIISQSANILAAVNINFQGNIFRKPETGVSLVSFGASGIYVGNRGANGDSLLVEFHQDGLVQAVANLRLVIQ